jgi:hypothetical protein
MNVFTMVHYEGADHPGTSCWLQVLDILSKQRTIARSAKSIWATTHMDRSLLVASLVMNTLMKAATCLPTVSMAETSSTGRMLPLRSSRTCFQASFMSFSSQFR